MQGARRVRLSPLYTPEFVVSPAVELLHAMDLVALADEWGAGFADWVYATRAALTEKEYADLAACNAAVSWSGLLARLYPDGQLAQSCEDLIRAVRALDAAAFGSLAAEDSSSEERRAVPRRAAQLRGSPAKLKETYVRTAEAFLEKHLRPRWGEDSVLLHDEAERRRERVWPATLSAWIETLTGRGVSPDPQFGAAARLVAIPTRLLGPYVTLSLLDTDPTTLLLLYGADRESERSAAPGAAGSRAAAGFKALGDETRLRILELAAEREMYAHEIGGHFSHVGQPAISRHLRYLAGLGLLTTRNAEAKTYYALNRASMRTLAAALEELASVKESLPERRRR